MKNRMRQQTIEEFRTAVNLNAEELEQFLGTDESKAVGWKGEGAEEAVGHRSGRQIVEILQKGEEDYTDDDLAHMQKVVAYVARHLAQRHHLTKTDPEHSKWRYSLMNWGHDPMKSKVHQ